MKDGTWVSAHVFVFSAAFHSSEWMPHWEEGHRSEDKIEDAD
jgi:hypothetical protein